MLNDVLYFAAPEGKYTMAVDCPECGFRHSVIDRLELVNGPISFECRREQSGRGLCGARWDIAIDENVRSKMLRVIEAHKDLRIAAERLHELAEKI